MCHHCIKLDHFTLLSSNTLQSTSLAYSRNSLHYFSIALFYFKGVSQEAIDTLPGGLESPTFRLTAERANQLRHGSTKTGLGHYSEPFYNKSVFPIVLHRIQNLTSSSAAFPLAVKRAQIIQNEQHVFFIAFWCDCASFKLIQLIHRAVRKFHVPSLYKIGSFHVTNEHYTPKLQLGLLKEFMALFLYCSILFQGCQSGAIGTLPGGLEPPTFRITAERANQLRHGSTKTGLGKYSEPFYNKSLVPIVLQGIQNLTSSSAAFLLAVKRVQIIQNEQPVFFIAFWYDCASFKLIQFNTSCCEEISCAIIV